MPRDLTRETGDNGYIEGDRVDLNDGDEEQLKPGRIVEVASPRRAAIEVMEAQRDHYVAAMCRLILDTVKIIEPLLEMVSARVLAFVAMGAAIALTAYTLRMLDDGWQRVSVLGGFLVLSAWVVRRGR